MNTATLALPSVSLICTENGSDKEYHVQVIEQGDGYVVNFQYGRRGATLIPGAKTAAPVSVDKATKIFQKLVAEKVAKGYREAGAATALTHFVESRDTGQRPQLLNAIDEAEMRMLIDDEHFVAQEKKDGKRIMLRIENGVVSANNKLGLTCSIPQIVLEDALRLPVPEASLDGEMVGDVFFVFDMLSLDHRQISHLSYRTRYAEYSALLASVLDLGIRALVALPACFSSADKAALQQRVKEQRGEGVVFKRASAPYTPGRPNSGGNALKFKFTESCSCVVNGISDAKRSVGLALLDAKGDRVEVGNVTVPPNQPIPALDAVVEIRFLYMFESGSLFQPILLGVRDDVALAECVLAQVRRIKPKSADADD